MKSNRAGFTMVELMVAIVVLTVGLLAMLGSSALSTRSITRERNIDLAAIYAARRLELIRVDGCTSQPVSPAEALMRGTETLAVNRWTFTPTRDTATNVIDGYRVQLTSTYFKAPVASTGSAAAYVAATHRTDTYETAISCAP
jgi:prepilin-type N-terminal cleavage/methylation domain-containing protein